MKKPLYPEELFKEDKVLFLKKLDLSNEEFENIMKMPIRSHFDFPVGVLPDEGVFPGDV